MDTPRPSPRTDRTRLGIGIIPQVWKWKEQYWSTINNQLRRLCSSLDWSREAFTMDDNLSLAVQVAPRPHAPVYLRVTNTG